MSNNQTMLGNIGYIGPVDEAYIHGCAWHADRVTQVAVIMTYQDKTEKMIANRYRGDLEAAGLGDGRYAFQFPLPCPLSEFDSSRVRICFEDGTPLEPAPEFLTWQNPLSLHQNILASSITSTVALEFTTRCNLRCVYCAVSQPWYENVDLPMEEFDSLIGTLQKRHVRRVVVNGHGETTLIPGWDHRILALANAGFELIITTNFARLLSAQELVAMAHIRQIEVSVDTHNPEILRKVRRKVDLGNILINMAGVTSKSAELRLPSISFSWSCVVSDKVAPYFLNYIRFGIACGVRNFRLYNLVEYDDPEGAENVHHVTTLPDAALEDFAKQLHEAQNLIQQIGGDIKIHAGLTDTLDLELNKRGLA